MKPCYEPLYVKNGKIFTGIGSFPYKGKDAVDKAVDYVARVEKSGGIIYFPELPNCGDSFLNPNNLKCFDAFMQKVNELKPDTIKGQCIGVVTPQKSGCDIDTAVQNIKAYISDSLYGLFGSKDIQKKPKEVIWSFDDPMLYLVDFDFDYKKYYDGLLDTLKIIGEDLQVQILSVVHCCGDLTEKPELRRFDALFSSGIDFISIDISKCPVYIYPAFRGGENTKKNIIWGFRNKEQFDLIKKYWQKDDMLSPPCGMATYKDQECEEMLEVLVNASKKF